MVDTGVGAGAGANAGAGAGRRRQLDWSPGPGLDTPRTSAYIEEADATADHHLAPQNSQLAHASTESEESPELFVVKERQASFWNPPFYVSLSIYPGAHLQLVSYQDKRHAAVCWAVLEGSRCTLHGFCDLVDEDRAGESPVRSPFTRTIVQSDADIEAERGTFKTLIAALLGCRPDPNKEVSPPPPPVARMTGRRVVPSIFFMITCTVRI